VHQAVNNFCSEFLSVGSLHAVPGKVTNAVSALFITFNWIFQEKFRKCKNNKIKK
jgi:hypothetical protein